MYNFRKRHVIVVNRCFMCKRNGEYVDHLLLLGEVVCALWNAFFSRFGVVLGYVCYGVEDVAFLAFMEGKE